MILIIFELWKKNKTVWEVAQSFELDRGFIQQITQSAASFTYGVLRFCECFYELWTLKTLLHDLMKRLQYECSAPELIPLHELDWVCNARAKQLYNAGFKDIETIAKSNPSDLTGKIKNLLPSAALTIIYSAKVWKPHK